MKPEYICTDFLAPHNDYPCTRCGYNLDQHPVPEDHWDEIKHLRSRNEQLWEALQEQRFIYYWRVEGMKVAQARIHADVDIGRMKAHLSIESERGDRGEN